MSNVVTLYFSSADYDIESVTNALPNRQFLIVLESWSTTKDIIRRFPNDTGSLEEATVKKKIEITEAVLIVDKECINALRLFLKVKPHSNFYPRINEDPTSLYCVFTPSQKKETDRIVNLFCDKMKIAKPKFFGNNGFSFYIFDTDDYVPQIIGLLNSYPSLEGAKFRYGRKRSFVKKDPKEKVTSQ